MLLFFLKILKKSLKMASERLGLVQRIVLLQIGLSSFVGCTELGNNLAMALRFEAGSAASAAAWFSSWSCY